MNIIGCDAVVNGGAGGIGRSLIRRLLMEGANHIACADLSPTTKDFAIEMNKTFDGEGVFPYVGDGTSQEFIQATFEDFIHKSSGPPEVLVNLIGVPLDSLVESYKPGSPMRVFTIDKLDKNLLINAAAPAAWAAVFAFYHDKRRVDQGLGNWSDKGGREEGVVIFTGSISAEVGIVGQLGYGMGKNALLGAVKVFKQECYERLGLRPVLIDPGFVETPMVTGMKQAVQDNVRQQIPCKEFMRVDEIVETYVYAIKCNSITGTLSVGNGYSCPPRLYEMRREEAKKVA